MATIIDWNGSKWAGEAPDSIEVLIDTLNSHPIGDFWLEHGVATNIPEGLDGKAAIHYWGNFADVSHCFSVRTSDEDVICALNAAVRRSCALARK